MSSLATISSLTLDGTSIQQSPIGIHLEITRGINEIPVYRGSDATIPHAAGRVPRSRIADRHTLELGGVVLGIGSTVDTQQASFRQLMRGLATLLQGAAADPVVLSGLLEDGATATINVRVIDYIAPETTSGLVAEPKIALESVDPTWSIVDP